MPSKTQLKVNALDRLILEHEMYVKEEQEIKDEISLLESQNDADEIRRKTLVLEETKKVKAKVVQMIKEHAVEVKKLGGDQKVLQAAQNITRA